MRARVCSVMLLCVRTTRAAKPPIDIPASWASAPTTAGASDADVFAALGERSLQCSACEIVTGKLFDQLGSNLARDFRSWSEEERLTKVSSAFAAGCASIEGMQLAMAGNAGSRRFGLMEELMHNGGNMGTLEVKPKKFADALLGACDALVQQATADVVAALSKRAKKKKAKLLGINLKGVLCESRLRVCGDDDDDDDDDKDEM
jgi:hypothetical protein